MGINEIYSALVKISKIVDDNVDCSENAEYMHRVAKENGLGFGKIITVSYFGLRSRQCSMILPVDVNMIKVFGKSYLYHTFYVENKYVFDVDYPHKIKLNDYMLLLEKENKGKILRYLTEENFSKTTSEF